MRILRPKRYRHFPDLSDAPARREQIIATARVFLAGGALIFAYLAPVRPARNSPMITTLLVGYLLLSVVLWITLRRRPTSDAAVRIGSHAADLLCTTALTVSSHGPSSPFFLFFVFVLLAAAYRWGFFGTMGTAGAGVALLAAEAYVLSPSSLPAEVLENVGLRVAQQFQITGLALQCVYLLMIGLLLGYLAEGEKSLQSEAAATARIVAHASMPGGLKAALGGMIEDLLAIFSVERVFIVAEEIENGRMFIWDGRRSRGDGRMELGLGEIERKRQADYRQSEDQPNWFAHQTREGSYHVAELGPETGSGTANVAQSPGVHDSVPSFLVGCDSILAVRFHLGGEWKGWVYLVGGRLPFAWRKDLAFLQRVIAAAAPAAYNTFLLSRMRSHIGAQERGRVARELHDGAIQSLLGAELQMHTLRRTATLTGQQDSFDGVENLIHDQVLNLRELMEKIRPIDLDPRRLPQFLAEQVEKFQRETGIEAVFSGDGAPVRLTGRACREVVRIAQELLFNVRRHSGAGRVELRLSSQDGTCRLEVSDNGRGFDFSGRFDQAALESMRKGPRVVQERVRTLGGQLTIESHPGQGARLEIALPQREA